LNYKKKKMIIEGKTKKIFATNDPGVVIAENKDTITAFNNPKFTKQFGSKAVCATITTCRVFEIIEAAGIPTAYVRQLSETEIAMQKCQMIPLEIIARREAVGSFLKRNQQFERPDGQPPYRFHNLKIEFFLKTSYGIAVDFKGNKLFSGLTTEQDDPFIIDHHSSSWELRHPGKLIYSDESSLSRQINPEVIIESQYISKIEETTRMIFLLLEAAWAQQGFKLIDFKIEFGINANGTLVVADVIDNDSWRLKDEDGVELSKEAYRQGEQLSKVERKYALVTEKVKNFRIPKQCLVVWTGSVDDPALPVEDWEGFVAIEKIVCSGHKKTATALDNLEKLMAKYPEGGVIIAEVGLSNGLGPILSTHTNWPIISVPITAGSFPDDVFSSLRLPSEVPMATILSPKNAVSYAMNILAQKNPEIYMKQRYMIEARGENY